MFDFSTFNNNLEGSSVVNIIIIALVSFVLSSLIALTYQKTSRGLEKTRYFIQALILISIPVATVMQAIGDSLARGLGMLGALAIIRFRTALRNPRDMVFMFSSIGVGIAAGVYGISIAIVGTLAFCLIVALIHFSPLSKVQTFAGSLRFETLNKEFANPELMDEIIATLKRYCKSFEMVRYNLNRKTNESGVLELVVFEYIIKTATKEKATSLSNELSQKLGLTNVKLNFGNEDEKI